MKNSRGRTGMVSAVIVVAVMLFAAVGVIGEQNAYAAASDPLTVTTGDDDGNIGSLRYALSNAADGDTIIFSNVTMITLQSEIVILAPNITIDGGEGVVIKAQSSGFRMLSSTGNIGTLTLIGLAFSNGGGVQIDGSIAADNCTFYANTVPDEGAGVLTASGSVTLRHCTFTGNSAGAGTAYNIFADAVNAVNCLMTQDGLTGNSNVTISGNNKAGTDDTNDSIAWFGNNTLTLNYIMPLPGIADNATNNSGLGTDAAGNTRGTTCMYGAVNSAAKSWIVTNSNPSGEGSLRQTMAEAEADPGTGYARVVYFADVNTVTGTSEFEISPGGEIWFTKDVRIMGRLGADSQPEITVNGNGGSRVFNHNGTNSTSYYYGLNIINGKVSGSGSTGAGIRSLGAVTIQDCEITSNTSGNAGGGVYAEGRLVLKSSKVTDNRSTSSAGGGVYSNVHIEMVDCDLTGNKSAGNGGAARSFVTINMTDCRIDGNTATKGNGGGIWAGNDIKLIDCTFSGNSATSNANEKEGNGGAVYLNQNSVSVRTLLLTDCTFENNTANHSGGAVYSGGHLTMTGSDFRRNAAGLGSGGAVCVEYVEDVAHNEAEKYLNVEATDCGFYFNMATEDGGGMYTDGKALLTGCTFEDNTANGFGGGLSVDTESDDNPGLPTLTITGCVFTTNAAEEGGGMSKICGIALVSNSTFSYNTAEYGGGMSLLGSSYSAVVNCTVAGNTAGGGIDCYYAYIFHTTVTDNSVSGVNGFDSYLYNCIVAGNGEQTDSSIDSTYGNLIEGAELIEGEEYPKVTYRSIFGMNQFDPEDGVQRVLGNGIAAGTATAIPPSVIDGTSLSADMKAKVKEALGKDQLGVNLTERLTYGSVETGEDALQSIAVVQDSTTITTYAVNDTIDLSGTILIFTYESGSHEDVPYYDPGIENTSEDIDMGTDGDKEIDFTSIGFSTGTGTNLEIYVGAIKTETTLTIAGLSKYGEDGTLTAEMIPDPTVQHPADPTGSVSFFDNGVLIGTEAISGGPTYSVMLAVPSLDAGQHTITAVYSGDAHFAGSSVEQDHDVSKAGTIVTIDIAPQTPPGSVYGQDVVITVNLQVDGPGSYSLENKPIIFSSDSSPGESFQSYCDSSGDATFHIASLPVGDWTITARFPGDSNLDGNNSNGAHTVTKVVTTVDLEIEPAGSSIYGEVVVLTATLMGAPSDLMYGKEIEFMGNGTPLGTALCDTSGQAVLEMALPIGNLNITAEFAGSDNLESSTSAAEPFTVSKAGTAVEITSVSPFGISVYGETVTITAVLTTGQGWDDDLGTKSIIFKETVSGEELGTILCDGHGVASLDTNILQIGAWTITAEFGGSDYLESSIPASCQYAVKAGTDISMTSSAPAGSNAGTNVTFTAQLSVVSPGSGTLTGLPIDFMLNGNVIGTEACDGSGIAVFSTSSLPVGNLTITARFGGNADLGDCEVAIPHNVSNIVNNSKMNQTGFGFTEGNAEITSIYKTYGDQPFIVTATGGQSTGGISYIIIGPATISGSTVTLTGAGTVTVTATHAGDSDYNPVSSTLTIYVAKKVLEAYVADAEKNKGEENPEFSIWYEGFVYSDNEDSLIAKPTASTTATKDSEAGEHPILLSGGESANYEINYNHGVLVIKDDGLNILPWLLILLLIAAFFIILIWYRRRKDEEEEH